MPTLVAPQEFKSEMRNHRLFLAALSVTLAFVTWPCSGQQRSPSDTGEPQVAVSHSAGTWTIAGKKNTVELKESDLAVSVHAGPVTWKMAPSSQEDLLVSAGGDQFHLRLADAGHIQIGPYETDRKSVV